MSQIVSLVQTLAKGGPVMIPLLACSIVSLAVIVERLAFWWREADRGVAQRALLLAERGKLDEALEVVRDARGPSARVLAAGLGERMRPLTDTTPKPLLVVRGKPLIQWHIERLRDAGFDRLVVNVAWLKQRLIEFVGDGSRFGVHIDISEEPAGALETAGAIVQALPLLGETFAVVNGDVFSDFDFNVLRSRLAVRDVAHLVLVPNPPQHPAGDFGLEDQRVVSSAVEQYTFTGIGLYRRELFANLEPGVRKLAPLLREGMAQQRVSGELHRGLWSDVGTVERLKALG